MSDVELCELHCLALSCVNCNSCIELRELKSCIELLNLSRTGHTTTSRTGCTSTCADPHSPASLKTPSSSSWPHPVRRQPTSMTGVGKMWFLTQERQLIFKVSTELDFWQNWHISTDLFNSWLKYLKIWSQKMLGTGSTFFQPPLWCSLPLCDGAEHGAWRGRRSQGWESSCTETAQQKLPLCHGVQVGIHNSSGTVFRNNLPELSLFETFNIHRVFMDQHGDVEGNYTLVSAQPLKGGGVGLLPTGRFVLNRLLSLKLQNSTIQVLPCLPTESEWQSSTVASVGSGKVQKVKMKKWNIF